MKFVLFFLLIFNFNQGFARSVCDGKSVEFKSQDFETEVLRYEPATPGQKSILIMPPTGGVNFLDRSYAKTFCENGFDVYVLKKWRDDDEYNLELEIHDRFYSRAQKALDLTVAQIQTPFIGILGTSVGALHTAIAMGRIEKINAAFIITGGSSIAEIIATSDQDVMVDARTKRFEKYKFKTDSEYIQALEKILPFEPLKLPPLFKGKYLGMVVATEDTTVPAKNQLQLQELWQPQVVLSLKANHMFSIIKTWFWHKSEVVQFFQNAVQKKLP